MSKHGNATDVVVYNPVVFDAIFECRPDPFKDPGKRLVTIRINRERILLACCTHSGNVYEFNFPLGYYMGDEPIRKVRIDFGEKHVTLIFDHFRRRGMLRRPKQYAAQPPALYYKYLLANDIPFVLSKRE